MTNKEWFDKYTNHIIDTELYAEGRAEAAASMLRKMSRELKAVVESYGVVKSKAKQKECEKECDDCIENYFSDWKKKEDKERQEHAEKETDWLSAALKAAFGIAVIASLLKTKKALETPFSPTDTFDSFVESAKEDIKKSIRTPLLSSRIFGSPTSTVSESLDSSFSRIERNFKANMQTSVTGLQRNIQYQLLEDKRKLKFVYISMLDDRTCVVCGGYSGTVYDDLSKAPAIPIHHRCRCYYMPIISSSSDIGKETYENWFDRQSDSVKYKILGATRYNFYKSGLSDITNFSSKGRKLTLKEMFEKTGKLSINTGARSEIVNKLRQGDVLQNESIATSYYNKLRNEDNKDVITRIANNTGKDYAEIESVINYVFKEVHKFEDGRIHRFDSDPDIIIAIERLKTNEFTDTDILWLNHELLELTLIKNKNYNIYELAHNKANETYNWQEAIRESLQ